MSNIQLRAVGLLGCIVWSAVAAADEDPARLFETRIRPLLVERCVKCHGPEKQKGRLRLDTLAAAREGGATGPAVVPGDIKGSLLIEAVRREGLEMPPDGALDPVEVDLLTQWIEQGATWSGSGGELAADAPSTRPRGVDFSDEDRAYWAFQPVRRAEAPEAADPRWNGSTIDRFVFDALAREGLSPSPPADRRALIRRLSFDVTGLPPSREEVASFEADDDPEAIPHLVDRLLVSPRYGERWGRHWLDLVRYAESDGFRADEYRSETWRYRDYVINSLNADKPYDRFIREQLAGDQLAPGDPESVTATQYLRLWTYESNQRDVVAQWSNILNDLTDVTADVFLGMGMACARCHDHKYDPIKQSDYFRMRAFFAPLIPVDDRPLVAVSPIAASSERLAAWELATSKTRARLEELEAPRRVVAERDAMAKLPPEIQAILRKSTHDRTPYETQLAHIAFRQVLLEWSKVKDGFKGEEKPEHDALVAELSRSDHLKPVQAPVVEQVRDLDAAPPTVIPGDRAESELEPGPPSLLDPLPTPLEGTTRRVALADWIIDPLNPMTARVMANRVWQYHFGRGLVETSSDFGRLG